MSSLFTFTSASHLLIWWWRCMGGYEVVNRWWVTYRSEETPHQMTAVLDGKVWLDARKFLPPPHNFPIILPTGTAELFPSAPGLLAGEGWGLCAPVCVCWVYLCWWWVWRVIKPYLVLCPKATPHHLYTNECLSTNILLLIDQKPNYWNPTLSHKPNVKRYRP